MRACHQVGPDAKNGVAPILSGLFGRKAGTVTGYENFEANKISGVIWDKATFAEYIVDPRKFIPATKMIFPGLKKESVVAAIVSCLKKFDARGNEK